MNILAFIEKFAIIYIAFSQAFSTVGVPSPPITLGNEEFTITRIK